MITTVLLNVTLHVSRILTTKLISAKNHVKMVNILTKMINLAIKPAHTHSSLALLMEFSSVTNHVKTDKFTTLPPTPAKLHVMPHGFLVTPMVSQLAQSLALLISS